MAWREILKHICIRLIGVFCVLLLTSSIGVAQSTEYKAATEKARTAFKAGEFLQAAEHFREAFEAESRGTLLYNIGICYEKAGQTAEAITFYQRFVDAVPGSSKAPLVQRKIATLREQMGSQYQSINVTTTPAGADIYVDDRARGSMGKSPISVRLLPGTYTVIADLKDHESAERQVVLEKGSNTSATLSLMRSSEVGTLKFRVSERDADVMIDRKRVGRTPIKKPIRIGVGSHDVLVMKPGFVNWARTVKALPGQVVDVDVQLTTEEDQLQFEASSSSGNLWPWILTGTGVAVVAGGITTGFMAKSLHDGVADKHQKQEPIAASDIDTGKNLVLITNVLYGVGGAIIAGGVTWMVLDSMGIGRSESLDTVVLPTAGGGALVQVGGQF